MSGTRATPLTSMVYLRLQQDLRRDFFRQCQVDIQRLLKHLAKIALLRDLQVLHQSDSVSSRTFVVYPGRSCPEIKKVRN